jgi:orotate phosphoribosyltransferase
MEIRNRRKRLLDLIEKRCLLVNTNINLSTGSKSSFYFDCKAITFDGEGLSLIAHEVLNEINHLLTIPTAIGGLTLGADPIVSAVILKAYELGYPTKHGSIVRKEPKKHGTGNKIENQLEAGAKIVVVDDVITTGTSTRKACEEFIRSDYEIVGIIALIDRQAGGMESLEKDFDTVRALFTRDDFPTLRGM